MKDQRTSVCFNWWSKLIIYILFPVKPVSCKACKQQYLRGTGYIWFSFRHVYKGDRYCDFLFAFQHTKPLLTKGVYSKRKEFAPLWNKFFPFRVHCTLFIRVANNYIPERVSIPIKSIVNKLFLVVWSNSTRLIIVSVDVNLSRGIRMTGYSCWHKGTESICI